MAQANGNERADRVAALHAIVDCFALGAFHVEAAANSSALSAALTNRQKRHPTVFNEEADAKIADVRLAPGALPLLRRGVVPPFIGIAHGVFLAATDATPLRGEFVVLQSEDFRPALALRCAKLIKPAPAFDVSEDVLRLLAERGHVAEFLRELSAHVAV